MAKQAHNWNGDDWQDRVKCWLSIRHKEDWVAVPDGHGGDFGIEGFSRSGYAYQCYCADGPLGVLALYEKQRDKMTADLRKFVENADDLKKVFGTTKIKRWILVVPKHQSSKLNQHATAKAVEIVNTGLDYLDGDFQVHIQT